MHNSLIFLFPVVSLVLLVGLCWGVVRLIRSCSKTPVFSAALPLPSADQGPKPQVLIRTYKGKREADAMAEFTREAAVLSAQGYSPTGQTWVAGAYSSGDFLKALLLIFFIGLGLLILGYMLIVKPPGTLTVTYTLKTITNPPAPPRPPVPHQERFYCFLNEEVIGPFDRATLLQMTLPAETPVCPEGSESWSLYGDV